ncbi:exo-alpha-sialidase [Niabella ginsengisoli]|uniref:exo-alpha-sialidase n=1 Tax=Niabella ginsengisoli TaxID=522298 RepID=UPI00374D05EE
MSKDNGETWGTFHESTMEAFSPVDMGFNKISINSKIYFLASFPSGPGRRNLVLSISNNEGKTWQKSRLICEGIVSYSDIAILKDGSLLILYGKGNPKQVIACRLDNDWLKNELL